MGKRVETLAEKRTRLWQANWDQQRKLFTWPSNPLLTKFNYDDPNFVKTMKYMHTHSAEQIADQMPKDYYGGDKALYVKALEASLPSFTADGRMPKGGPDTVLQVLSTFKPQVKAAHIDLSKTYTTAFVDAAR